MMFVHKSTPRVVLMSGVLLSLLSMSTLSVVEPVYAATSIVPSVLPPSPEPDSITYRVPFGSAPPFSESKCDTTIPVPALYTDQQGPEAQTATLNAQLAILNNRLSACVIQIRDTYHPPKKDINGRTLFALAEKDCNPASEDDYPDVYKAETLQDKDKKDSRITALQVKTLLKAERFARCAAFANQTFPANTARALCNAVGPFGFAIGLYAAIFSKRWNSGLQGGIPFFAASFPNVIQNEPACK